jgi:hypothetical protein
MQWLILVTLFRHRAFIVSHTRRLRILAQRDPIICGLNLDGALARRFAPEMQQGFAVACSFARTRAPEVSSRNEGARARNGKRAETLRGCSRTSSFHVLLPS